MPETPEDSPLERMRKRLYTTPSVDGVKGIPLSSAKTREAEHWKEELPKAVAKKGLSGSVIFLIFAVGFFGLAGIVAGVLLFLGGRSVSGEQLVIGVEGPTTISGGESIPLLITVRNDNPTVVSGAVLEIDFPEGTFEAEDASVPLPHASIELGEIAAGGTVRETVRAAFFGEENQRMTIPITVEYRTGKSNATFIANESYSLVISTAPVTLSVSALSEVPSGQSVPLVLTARSNATTPLQNVAIRADYPFGFVPVSESPKPDGELFVLGTLLPGEDKEVRITGPLSGQEGEERVFDFAVGSLKEEGGKEFGVPYSSKEVIIAISRPFLTVGLSVNRSEDASVVIKAGELAAALVSWKNALSAAVLDGKISVKLSGDALDPESVEATNGFYRSADRTILFDSTTSAGLKTLEPGDSGNGSFIFSTKTGSAMNALRNPSIQMSVSISGRRVGQGNVPESVTSTVNRTIKIETDLSVSARSVRTEGPFENSGPWPPTPDKETTYTILLDAKNTVNTVANATVKMTLPSYVRFTGLANPASAVKFNESTRELTWALDSMAPGASKSVAFQVALLPSVSQKGTSPLLTSEIVITGHDRFVDKETTGKAQAVSTETNTDPDYQNDFGSVK